MIFGHHTYSGLEQKGPDTWEEAAWIFDLAARTTTPLPPRNLTGRDPWLMTWRFLEPRPKDGWVRVFSTATRKELPAERWKAHTTEITALAVSQGGDMVATAGGGIVAFWSAEKVPEQPRRERLKLVTGTLPRNWMQFGREDSVFLHCAPYYPIEAWEARQ